MCILCTFARWKHGYVLLLPARGDTVAPGGGLYTRLCHAFLVYFFFLQNIEAWS